MFGFCRCVENVLRAKDTVDRLKARLASAERDRDDAIRRLHELNDTQRAHASVSSQRPVQEESSTRPTGDENNNNNNNNNNNRDGMDFLRDLGRRITQSNMLKRKPKIELCSIEFDRRNAASS